MTDDASVVVGSAVLAGCKVNRWGFEAQQESGAFSSHMMADMPAQAAGDVVTAAILARKAKQRESLGMSSAPNVGDHGYLAVTAEELVLIKVERGLVMTHLGDVVARVPRSDVAGAELDRSAISASAVAITFTNGRKWLFEAPLSTRHAATVVVGTLQA